MWADRANWKGEMAQKSPMIKPEVWDFISRANAAKKE
jgi:hypothetical protein